MVLAGESFEPATREGYRRSIVAALHHLKERRERASAASVKAYVKSSEAQGVTEQFDRNALRWFFLAARRRVDGGRQTSNSGIEEEASPIHPEKADTGKTPWERRLVERLRVGQYRWRTEVTCWDWAWRFSVWLGTRPLDDATDTNLKDFLTYLAVDRALAACTQRQALNALIFLFREVLGREPGNVSGYTPSRRAQRVPEMLTPDELRRLFDHLRGMSPIDGPTAIRRRPAHNVVDSVTGPGFGLGTRHRHRALRQGRQGSRNGPPGWFEGRAGDEPTVFARGV